MWPDNRVLDLLGVELPIITSPAVAAAHSDARGKYMLFKSCSTGGKICGH
jgi:hypothetical protein